jgi:hypothetical protein
MLERRGALKLLAAMQARPACCSSCRQAALEEAVEQTGRRANPAVMR